MYTMIGATLRFYATTSYLVINLYYLRHCKREISIRDLCCLSEIYRSRKRRRVTLLWTFNTRNGTSRLGWLVICFCETRRNTPFAISTEMDYLGETSPRARFANVLLERSISSFDRSSRFTWTCAYNREEKIYLDLENWFKNY